MIQLDDKKKEVYSTDRYMHRLGTEHYGKRMTLINGEDVTDFEEVDVIPQPVVESEDDYYA